MVYDRTLADVKQAIELQKRGAPFSSSEKNVLARGMLGIDTINRIESKQQELHDKLNDLGYYSDTTNKTNWQYADFFVLTNFQRLCNNNSSLRRAFFVYNDTPPDAIPKYHYEQINRLEKILYDIERMIPNIGDPRLICGTFYCGEY